MAGRAKSQVLVDDLRRCIALGQVVVVAGAGVSINVTQENQVASWTGLIKDGVKRCEDVVAKLPARWGERVRDEIASGDREDLLSAAGKIASKLKDSGGEYSSWLRESVGSLQPKRPGVIRALKALNVPIVTTNYDGLFESVTGWPAVTWKQPQEVERVLREWPKEPAVIHLHGFWKEPASVVLGHP